MFPRLTRRRSPLLGLSLVALAPACTATLEPTPPEEAASAHAAYREKQGRSVTSRRSDRAYVRLTPPGTSFPPAVVYSVQRGVLMSRVLTRTKRPLTSTVTFPGFRPTEAGGTERETSFRVQPLGARPDEGVGTSGEHHYLVDYDVGGTFVPLCPDASGVNQPALVAAGRQAELYEPDGKYATFMCPDSAAGKCVNLGYEPWTGHFVGAREAPVGAHHASCVNLMRAAYCGGRDHTRDETTVDVFDEMGVNGIDDRRRPGEPEMYFEAGWIPSGAVCLTKLRWSMYPPGTYFCNGNLRDPRIDPCAKYCEELRGPSRWPDGTAAGRPLVYSRSYLNDIALYTWRSTSDRGGYVTTTEGTFAGYGARAGDTRPPVLGDGETYATEAVGFEGILFHPTAPPPTGVVPLHRYRRTSRAPGWFTGTAPPGAGWERAALLGYVFPPGPAPEGEPSLRELVSYVMDDGTYVTTTRDPWSALTRLRSEGWVAVVPRDSGPAPIVPAVAPKEAVQRVCPQQ